ncbi:hypothetical protein AAG570_001266, partial [Ranatra chinensis]
LIFFFQNLQLVAVPKDKYGTFYDGDSYIIYAASEYGSHINAGHKPKEVRGRIEMHIHFWLGAETSQDESAVAAYKSVELDDLLGGTPVQHREVMGHESLRFRSYFKQGMRILRGGVSSGLHAVNNNFEPRLMRVKGRRRPVITQMPEVAWKYFNSGDVFIIDTKDVVFVWIGKGANNMEKLQAANMAMKFKDEHNAVSIVFVDEGKENELSEAEKTLLGVYLDLSPLAKSLYRGMMEVTDDKKSEADLTTALRLYKCSDADGTYRVTEVKAGPLQQSDLDSNDSYIIDHSPHRIWVWVGRKASTKERQEAMRNAHGFVSKKNYVLTTHVTRVLDGGEPAEFRALFSSWRDKDSTNVLTKSASSKLSNASLKVVPQKLDAGALHEMPHVAAKEQLIDDGSGIKSVWRVLKTELVPVPASTHGIFYSGDCYIIKYEYVVQTKKRYILYYWLGLHSTVSEQTAVAFLTVHEGDLVDHNAVHARVVEGREPPHFLALFKGMLLVMQGEHSDVLPPAFMFQVRGNSAHNTRATQVHFKASSLNSNDVFVATNGVTSYIWCGKGSTGDEREMSKVLAQAFIGPEYTVVYEGQEKDDFWQALGGKDKYSNFKRLQEPSEDRNIRLFHCSNATGSFKVEEIVDFCQTDLLPEDVMLLDAVDTIFVWIGNQANREERIKAIQLAFDYLHTDPSGRDKHTPIVQIHQGYEPPNFIGFFGAWDSELWSNQKCFEELRKELDGMKPQLQVELKVANGSLDFDQAEKFPIEILQEKDPDKLPLTVDVLHKEVHLTHEDFVATFGMDYSKFCTFPKWRQENMKKNLGLF